MDCSPGCAAITTTDADDDDGDGSASGAAIHTASGARLIFLVPRSDAVCLEYTV